MCSSDLLLAGSAQYELWAKPFYEQVEGARWAHAIFLAFATVSLLWRQRMPLAVLGTILVSVVLESLLLDDWTSFQTFVALIVAVYSVAAHADLRRAVLGAAVSVVLLGADQIGSGTPLVEVPGPWILMGAAWIGGRVMRRRRQESAFLTDRAATLERERDENARAAVAEERTRIARELHDVIAHSVSVMVVQAQAAQRVLEGEQASAREALGSIETTGRQALVEMRRLLGMLRKDDRDLALAPQPSLTHLDYLLEHVREAGLPVELRTEGEPRPLPPGVDLSAYRIVQEALTNSLRHAGPARARVTVRYRENDIEVEIADDGRGASNGGGSGHGLVGMRERVAVYGGVLESGNRDGSGYSVRACLPA